MHQALFLFQWKGMETLSLTQREQGQTLKVFP